MVDFLRKCQITGAEMTEMLVHTLIHGIKSPCAGKYRIQYQLSSYLNYLLSDFQLSNCSKEIGYHESHYLELLYTLMYSWERVGFYYTLNQIKLVRHSAWEVPCSLCSDNVLTRGWSILQHTHMPIMVSWRSSQGEQGNGSVYCNCLPCHGNFPFWQEWKQSCLCFVYKYSIIQIAHSSPEYHLQTSSLLMIIQYNCSYTIGYLNMKIKKLSVGILCSTCAGCHWERGGGGPLLFSDLKAISPMYWYIRTVQEQRLQGFRTIGTSPKKGLWTYSCYRVWSADVTKIMFLEFLFSCSNMSYMREVHIQKRVF